MYIVHTLIHYFYGKSNFMCTANETNFINRLDLRYYSAVQCQCQAPLQ